MVDVACGNEVCVASRCIDCAGDRVGDDLDCCSAGKEFSDNPVRLSSDGKPNVDRADMP